MKQISIPQVLHLRVIQGADEKRSKRYDDGYRERASQTATPKDAKSVDSATSCAGGQGDTLRRLW